MGISSELFLCITALLIGGGFSVSSAALDDYEREILESRKTCGPIALWYCLNAYGIHIEKEKVIAQAAVGEQGVSLQDLVALADALKFPGSAVEIAPETIQVLPSPSIMVLNIHHSVVFLGLDAETDTVRVFDPTGAVTKSIPRAELDALWDGMAIVFERPVMTGRSFVLLSALVASLTILTLSIVGRLVPLIGRWVSCSRGFLHRSPGPVRAGFTLIELMVVIAIVALLLGLLLVAIQRARDSANRVQCINNLHQIGIGLHHYHDAHGRFPPGCNNWRVDSRHDYHHWWLSWMAQILPFVEQGPLWDQTAAMQEPGSFPPCNAEPFPYNLSLPFDICVDPTGRRIQRFVALATVQKLYACPSDSRILEPHLARGNDIALTSYLGVTGVSLASWSSHAPTGYPGLQPRNAGVLIPTNKYDFALGDRAAEVSSTGSRLADISDGTSVTLLVGERPPSTTLALGWWFAGIGQSFSCSCDVVLGATEVNLQRQGIPELDGCEVGPYEFAPGQLSEPCDQFHYWSLHPGGSNFLFCDGSARFLSYSAAEVLPALATRAGGETVEVP